MSALYGFGSVEEVIVPERSSKVYVLPCVGIGDVLAKQNLGGLLGTIRNCFVETYEHLTCAELCVSIL